MIDLGGNTCEPVRSSHYTHLGYVTEFRYSRDIGRTFRRHNGFTLASLQNFGSSWLPSNRALVFVDNHDNQRGHGPGYQSINQSDFISDRKYMHLLLRIVIVVIGHSFVVSINCCFYLTLISSWYDLQGPHCIDCWFPFHCISNRNLV